MRKIVTTFLLSFFILLPVHQAFAVEATTNCSKLEQEVKDFADGEPIPDILSRNCYSSGGLVAKVIQTVTLVSATAAIIFIVLAAHGIITSAGNSEKVAAARRQITWALLGLVAIIMAYTIIYTQTTLVGEPKVETTDKK